MASSADKFDLGRFIEAQAPHYDVALAELNDGRKYTHWMWFIFPQVEGLGTSPMARRYAIKSPAEAIAYIAHPLLGARLLECTKAALGHRDRSAHEIFGSPDDAKFRSSLTLFELAGGGPIFLEALRVFFEGQCDPATISIYANWKSHP